MNLLLFVVIAITSHSRAAQAIQCVQCTGQGKDCQEAAKECQNKEENCFVEKSAKDEYKRGCAKDATYCGTKTKKECAVCAPVSPEKTCTPKLEGSGGGMTTMKADSTTGTGKMTSVNGSVFPTAAPGANPIWCIQCNPWPTEKRDSFSCAETADSSKGRSCVEGNPSHCYVRFNPDTAYYERGCTNDKDICKGNEGRCAICQPSGPGKDKICVPKLDKGPTKPPPAENGIDCVQCYAYGSYEGAICATNYDQSSLMPCPFAAENQCFVTRREALDAWYRGCTSIDKFCETAGLKDDKCTVCKPDKAKGELSCIPKLNPEPKVTNDTTATHMDSTTPNTPTRETATTPMGPGGRSACTTLLPHLSLITAIVAHEIYYLQ